MNMSEDIAGSVVQVGTQIASKGVDLATDGAKRTMDLILKLLNILSKKNKAKQLAKDKITSTNLTDIKSGEISVEKMKKYVKKNNDSISYSKNGITAEDKAYLVDFAKKNNFPISFISQSKDCFYPTFRTADAQLVELGCSQMIKDKIATRSSELGNFVIKPWEQSFLTAEFKKHDLSCNFAKTKNDEIICLYEKTDEKAIMIARNEYISKADKLNSDYAFEKDENGMYSIKENRSGNQVSFDEIPSKSELQSMLIDKFGFDENTADMASAKFGEELLSDTDKSAYFSKDIKSEFADIQANVTVEGESILVKPYNCWYLTEKDSQKSSIVFQNDKGVAVIQPNMSKSEMKKVIKDSFQLTDENEINALTTKAYKVSRYFKQEQQGLYSSEYNLKTDDKNIDCKAHINRTAKDKAEIHIEGSQGEGITHTINIRDKKTSKKELTELFKKQGLPDSMAERMAEDTFKKAKTQSPDNVFTISKFEKENKTDPQITVEAVYNGKISSFQIDPTEKETALNTIQNEYQISEMEANAIWLDLNDTIEEIDFLTEEKVDTNINFEEEISISEEISDSISDTITESTEIVEDIMEEDDDMGIGGM